MNKEQFKLWLLGKILSTPDFLNDDFLEINEELDKMVALENHCNTTKVNIPKQQEDIKNGKVLVTAQTELQRATEGFLNANKTV